MNRHGSIRNKTALKLRQGQNVLGFFFSDCFMLGRLAQKL
jgi:hypothetical protein